MYKIIIGTRGSILALAQAEKIKEMLIKKYFELKKNNDKKINEYFSNSEKIEIEIKTILTKGDKDLTDFEKMKGNSQKDLFIKEIENEMLEHKIDIAVHSTKDMPSITPKGLINKAFPIREDNRDVLISKTGKKLYELPKNAIIGTGSSRREYELLNLRDDIIIKPIRGNIHTRIKKLYEEDYDAIILASAGLKRVGLEDKITEYFEIDNIMPAPAQGILCVQCREDDKKMLYLLDKINDEEVNLMCEAEREFSKIFNGGCHIPIGCSSEIIGDNLTLKGIFYSGKTRILKVITGNKNNAKMLAQKLAEEIKKEI